LQPAHTGTKAPRTFQKPALEPQEASELGFLGGMGFLNLTERHFAAGTHRHKSAQAPRTSKKPALERFAAGTHGHKSPQDAQEAGT